jgi:hypothetical protein
MVCKCGAMVKASARSAEITGIARRQGQKAPSDGLSSLGRGIAGRGLARGLEPPRSAGSGTRDDRGRLEGGNHRIGRRRALASAVEQYSPFEGARTQKRIAGQNPVTHRRQMRGHQPDRLDEARIRSRLAPGFMQEHAPVKRLMLGTHDRQSIVGIEMDAGHGAQPDSHVGKLRKIPRL